MSKNLQEPNRELQSNKLSLIEEDEVISRPSVHPILLDENNFRINGLRVGQQTFLKAETPVVIYEMPLQADYVEILRCPDNVIIHGGADSIDYVELGSKDLQTETRIYQRNNFWEAAVITPGCILIATSYTDTSYEDSSASSGTFNYYIRACVDQGRLLNIEGFSSTNCSRQVSRSPEYNHINRRQKAELEALAEASLVRSKIDTINRQIVNKTIELNQQLFGCQEKHQTRVINEEKKSAISAILGGVIAFGIPVLGTVGFKGRQYFRPDYDFSSRTVIAKKNKLLTPNISEKKLASQKQSLIRSLARHEGVINQRINKLPDSTKLQNKTRKEALESELKDVRDLSSKVSEIDPKNQDYLKNFGKFKDEKIGVDLGAKVSKGTRAAQVLAATSITTSSALLISHAFMAGSQSLSSFPRDAKACYGVSDKLRTDQVFCGCAKALSIQEDLNTLAEDLEQTMRLQQQHLNKAEIARDPEA